MITSSAHDGKEMSTTVNRCSHLDEHNISQAMSKDILQRVNNTPFWDALAASGNALLCTSDASKC
jgi:hypothetical protein